MNDIEKIMFNNKVYAIIIRKEVKVDDVNFFTHPSYPFQIGVHLKSKGSKIEAHIHRPFSDLIKSRQEFIHVDYGKVKITIYDENKKNIGSRILNSGDSFLAIEGGHGFNFLSKTKLIEVKQGPYDSTKNDKEKIHLQNNKIN